MSDNQLRICKKCCVEKNITAFIFRDKSKGIYKHICKDCYRIKHKVWRDLNIDKMDIYSKNHKQKHNNFYTYNYLYNITREQYLKYLNTTKCDLCAVDLTDKKKCQDHCHKTGKVRGVLCMKCNTYVGFYEKLKENREFKTLIKLYVGEKICEY
jgi:hypothetical protein